MEDVTRRTHFAAGEREGGREGGRRERGRERGERGRERGERGEREERERIFSVVSPQENAKQTFCLCSSPLLWKKEILTNLSLAGKNPPSLSPFLPHVLRTLMQHTKEEEEGGGGGDRPLITQKSLGRSS